MSGQAGVGHLASSQVNLLNNLFSKLYATFSVYWITFIFGRDEEEDQQVFHMQEREFSLSLLFKIPVHNAVRCFSCFLYFCGGMSNEYPQCFCAEIRKIHKSFGWKKYLIWSYNWLHDWLSGFVGIVLPSGSDVEVVGSISSLVIP